ncbi:hypothetical protein NSU_4487 [Novosphingobium pentaromativorans US6-1]|uniref:Uncharacterized protein n=1 Tax=Novosphingobium pentaromativorans US6-1 TaxID=1088721 RepID=G6EJG6_9SPHN|nr:hypothetical protein NSU_4487 [Novosphingobium pentaromativorans US6-1]
MKIGAARPRERLCATRRDAVLVGDAYNQAAFAVKIDK